MHNFYLTDGMHDQLKNLTATFLKSNGLLEISTQKSQSPYPQRVPKLPPWPFLPLLSVSLLRHFPSTPEAQPSLSLSPPRAEVTQACGFLLLSSLKLDPFTLFRPVHPGQAPGALA